MVKQAVLKWLLSKSLKLLLCTGVHGCAWCNNLSGGNVNFNLKSTDIRFGKIIVKKGYKWLDGWVGWLSLCQTKKN